MCHFFFACLNVCVPISGVLPVVYLVKLIVFRLCLVNNKLWHVRIER